MVAVMSSFVTVPEGVVVLAFQPQPIDFISKAAKLCGKDAVMDPDVARMAGANVAAGSPKALTALRARLEAGAKLEASRQTKGLGLPPGAAEWLGAGERGISAETIFSHLTGFNVLRDHRGSHPRDPADWRRCQLLLEAVPKLELEFHRMRELGAVWSALVDGWSRINTLMDIESADWRNPAIHGSARQAYDLMKQLISGAGGA